MHARAPDFVTIVPGVRLADGRRARSGARRHARTRSRPRAPTARVGRPSPRPTIRAPRRARVARRGRRRARATRLACERVGVQADRPVATRRSLAMLHRC